MPSPPSAHPPDLSQWRALVERDLKGRDFDRSLVRRDVDGLETRPLYTAADVADVAASGWPGAAPWTRGRRAAGGWSIVQRVLHPDIAVARSQVVDELGHGADGVLLSVDIMARGFAGVRTPLAASLRQLLGGIEHTGGLVGFEPGAHFLTLAGALGATDLLQDAAVHLGADPVGVLARTGELPGGSRALGWLGDVAVWCHDELPGGRAVAIDTSPYHLAGASDVDDLAIALATGVTALRALSDAGLSIDDALEQIVFRVPLDTMMLAGVARLRALRLCWGRIASASGASDDTGGAWIHALPARRSLTSVDPWVNLLRGTVMCFSGACGGADAVTVAPFDGARGLASDAGRRQARNTQLVLALESHLGRTLDPAGGSAFIEVRTDQLARRAWARFQALEAAGGIIPALEAGLVQRWIADARSERDRRIATRQQPITGVSAFPKLDERRLGERSAPSPARAPRAPELGLPTLPDPGAGALTAALVTRIAGPDAQVPLASFTEVAALPSLTVACEALPEHPLAADFEAMRARSDALLELTGRRPTACLVTLGRLAEHNPRTTFARNLLAAGGIDCVERPVSVGSEGEAAIAPPAEGEAPKLAVLCGSDAGYRDHGAVVIEALRAEGAGVIWLAGWPDPPGGPVKGLPAGLVPALYAGCDVISVLRAAWRCLVPGGAP